VEIDKNYCELAKQRILKETNFRQMDLKLNESFENESK
jgi:DNA modification methylase